MVTVGKSWLLLLYLLSNVSKAERRETFLIQCTESSDLCFLFQVWKCHIQYPVPFNYILFNDIYVKDTGDWWQSIKSVVQYLTACIAWWKMCLVVCSRILIHRSASWNRIESNCEGSANAHPYMIPNHNTITWNQWICIPLEWSKQVFLKHSTIFQVFCFYCLNLLKTLLRHQFHNKHIFPEIKKLMSSKMKYIVFVQVKLSVHSIP